MSTIDWGNVTKDILEKIWPSGNQLELVQKYGLPNYLILLLINLFVIILIIAIVYLILSNFEITVLSIKRRKRN